IRVRAAEKENPRPRTGLRILRMAEVAVVFLVAAADANDFDRRQRQLGRGAEVLLRLQEPLLLALHLRRGQENVRHAIVLVGLKNVAARGLAMPAERPSARRGLRAFSQVEPAALPSFHIPGIQSLT